MKKIFQKNYMILPLVVILYGIYAMNRELMDEWKDFLNKQLFGWDLILQLFLGLMAGTLYLLRENQKWEYIYSFPMTKKKLFQESIGQLYFWTFASSIIYAVFFGVKCWQCSDWDTLGNIVLIAIMNVLIVMTKCVAAGLLMIGTQYFWQGAIAAILFLFIIWKMFLDNLGYCLLVLIRESNEIINQIFFQQSEVLRLPVELNYHYVDYSAGDETIRQFGTWAEYYPIVLGIFIVCMILFLIFAGIMVKKLFIEDELGKSHVLSRMKHPVNEIFMISILSLVIFHGTTNILTERRLAEIPGERESFWGMILQSKASYFSYDVRFLGSPMETVLILTGAILISILAVRLIQKGRRETYE